MKIAYQHLLKFFKQKPSIEDLSNRLFQLGHEHEIENNIFNMEFTPNRGDCLSLLGLSRDLNIFFQSNLDLPIYKKNISSLNLNFNNQEKNKCPEISFLNIEIDGQISEYKDYLQNYFDDLKLNKNNFFTDISNYIAYELGQPTHCYDFSLLDKEITLNINKSNSKFKTLLNNTIDLNGPDLIFSCKDEIINLSGVVGGMSTSCTKESKNVLIECAYFKPDSIIGRAIKYNINSDASHKFERGTDPKCHDKVLRRFIQIVNDHAEIIKLELFTESNNDFKQVELDFDLDKVNNILGLSVSETDYKNYLMKLGFNIEKNIQVPSYRNDIKNQNDLAEELARMVGYDNIPTRSINLNHISQRFNSTNHDQIKAFLVDHGFTEVINSTFCSIKSPSSIKVDNPLDSNRENLRINLIDSLATNIIYNEKRQQDSIKLFEVSDIYTTGTNSYKKKLAIIVSGRRGQNYVDFSKKLDKKYLCEVFQEMNMNIEKDILSIDRETLNSKIKTPIFAIELNIDDVSKNFKNYIPINKISSHFIKYKPISEFPSSIRDFSFSVKDSSKISELIHSLSDAKSEIIKSSYMFDFFENKKTNESKIGFRFIFQSQFKTLTDKEINDEINPIIESILSIKSVSLPGIS